MNKLLNYFISDEHNYSINLVKSRQKRKKISGFLKSFIFSVGDILEIVYFKYNLPLIFSGVCIAVKRRSFKMPDVVLILRNVIMRIGIELTVSYYYNRVYSLSFLNYKRKMYSYSKNRLYFIRYRLNKESKV